MSRSSAVPKARRPRVGLVSLGCAKNLVDAEIMLGSLLKSGVEVVSDPSEADALIVNTCSFIDAAQEESVDTILESVEFREHHRPGQAVIVSGCLPQRFREDLPKLMPEVDAFMGVDQVERVGEIVGRAIEDRSRKVTAVETGKAAAKPAKGVRKSTVAAHLAAAGTSGADTGHGTVEGAVARRPVTLAAKAPAVEVHVRPSYIPGWDTPRFRLTPPHFAYLKIAEGCNHPCSFCIIPRMRGSHRSRPQADVVAEARELVASGVREINLISQDSTYYGLDLRAGHSRAISSPARFREAAGSLPAGATTLATLLRELNAIPGDFWIRLLYTHPAHWTDDVIRAIAESPKVARYVDMPLQHIHDDMLARMRRETDGAYIRGLIRRLRAGIPGLALRTTFIVGFPGETQAHFQALLDFIRDTRFERLGVFAYSQEEGTIAGRMEKQVPPATRQRRRERAMAVQHEVADAVSASFVGRELKVLVEGLASEEQVRQANLSSWEHGLLRDGAERPRLERGKAYMVARGEADAPDIDGRIYIRGSAPKGEFVRVRVIGHTTYDLVAERV